MMAYWSIGGDEIIDPEKVPITVERLLYEQWAALKQESDVREYCKRFIESPMPLDNILDEVTMGIFINGLKSYIRADV